jgi:predicted HicB family RNase H-like nuclease
LLDYWYSDILASMKAKPAGKEATTMVKFTVRLSPELLEEVQIRKIREKITLEQLAARAFEAYLKTPIPGGRGGAR